MLKMREQNLIILNLVVNDVSEIIDKRKNDYNYHLASNLNNPKTSAKTYW